MNLPLDHLRSLPDGSLTQQEVTFLCDEIDRLTNERRQIADAARRSGTTEGLRSRRGKAKA